MVPADSAPSSKDETEVSAHTARVVGGTSHHISSLDYPGTDNPSAGPGMWAPEPLPYGQDVSVMPRSEIERQSNVQIDHAAKHTYTSGHNTHENFQTTILVPCSLGGQNDAEQASVLLQEVSRVRTPSSFRSADFAIQPSFVKMKCPSVCLVSSTTHRHHTIHFAVTIDL